MTQNTLKRSAYAALGVPIDVANKLMDRVRSTRETLEEARDRMSDQVSALIEDWADEGERLVSTLSDRSSEAAESLEVMQDRTMGRTAAMADAAAQVADGLVSAATTPVVPLERIAGIGPAFAKRLKTAGVLSAHALVERAGTAEGREELGRQTDIPTASLAQWATDADLTRINGVGEEYMNLLNAAGVASISDLRDRKPEELRSELVSVHADTGMGDALPSQETLRSWISSAKKLK